MAKKMNQESSHGNNSYSDPEDDDSSAEQTRRDDERGRTVLAKVGKAIQNGNKITLELHPVYKVPCGDNRKTLSTYIGVVVRERVNINYMKWRNVPREVVNEVYEFIGKGFDIPSISKSWILRRASIRFRAFKTRLRKFWVYKPSGKIRKTVPWKYPWISQVDWDKFVEYCTSPEYQELSKKSKERSLQKKTSYRGGCRGYLYYEEQIIKRT